MLEELRIRNLALIRDSEITFEEGLNFITGETGAGKTMLVQALSLIGGSRASSEWVGSEGTEAWVEARFTRVHVPWIDKLLEEAGLPSLGDEVLIKRSIAMDGRSKAYVNGSMVSIGFLCRLASYLMTISGQFENQRLLRPENHMLMLDEFLGLESLREELNEKIEGFTNLLGQLESLRERLRSQRKDQELIQAALREIQEANLRPGEEEELIREKERLRHATEIKLSLREALEALELGRGSAQEMIGHAARSLGKGVAYEPRLKPQVEALESIKAHVLDLCWELRRLEGDIVVDPQRLELILDRLELINRLKKRYGGSIEAILAYKEEVQKRAAEADEMEFFQKRLEKSLKEAKIDCLTKARELSSRRQEGAGEFARQMEKELRELNMPHMRFQVDLRAKEEKGPGLFWLKNGMEEVEFLICPNPGEDLRPLSRIASGGELSRITLAMKAIITGGKTVETLIFDEVDQGIGGITAGLVGKKLGELSKTQQIICITHLPQIAAQPGNHLVVEKLVQGNKTYTTIKRLGPQERTAELARMMGGVSYYEASKAKEGSAEEP